MGVPFAAYGAEIYFKGLADERPALPTDPSRLQEVAAEAGDAPRWYQLYWPTEDDVTVSILERARAAGHRVLVVTLDTWTLGWRPHDLDLSYLPFLRGVGTAIPFSDAAFRAGL